jgi:hypothetical protein
MFCRPKDYFRIATTYDKLANAFLAAIYLPAAVTWWLCFLPLIPGKVTTEFLSCAV